MIGKQAPMDDAEKETKATSVSAWVVHRLPGLFPVSVHQNSRREEGHTSAFGKLADAGGGGGGGDAATGAGAGLIAELIAYKFSPHFAQRGKIRPAE